MERWQLIESLFHETLQRPATERDAFLCQACDGDSELLQEVQSLVANHCEDTNSQPWAAQAAAELIAAVPTLEPGQNLGPYEIVSFIAMGGMGAVYRARDPRMGRDVAIKICAERFNDRFSGEVQAVAALPAHLLALALSTPNWRRMISPRDKPWAYINRTTQLIYQRSYAEGNGSANPQEDAGLLPDQIDERVDGATVADELVIESIADVVRNSGCSTDVTSVLVAWAGGKKWNELPKHLTGLTGTNWDRRRVEAARATFGRRKNKLRASAWAGSQWKACSNKATCYRERLGVPWNGLWTYFHSLRGANLEIDRGVMSAERKKLFREY
jgi:hypothetical protein